MSRQTPERLCEQFSPAEDVSWGSMPFAAFLVASLWTVSTAGCGQQPMQPSQATTVSVESQETVELNPVAVVDETDAYLGVLEPSDKIEKRFVIRNEGKGPLLLERGGTSCTCTMSALPDKPILPGQGAVVVVSTKSEEKVGSFDHTATVLTNDPNHRRIVFRIYGKFQLVLAFDPPKLVVSSMKGEDGGKAMTVDTIAYSEVFRDFEVESISSTLEGLSWEINRANDIALKTLEARCGCRLTLTVPASGAQGDLLETLTLKVRSDDNPPVTKEAKCTITRNLLPRTTFAGKNYQPFSHTLQMGSFSHWQGGEDRMTLAVRDEHRILDIKEINKTPDFLEVEVVPMVPENLDSGLYWIRVKVPKDAPPSNHNGSRKGQVRIVTDHPANPEMSFWVQFVVTNS